MAFVEVRNSLHIDRTVNHYAPPAVGVMVQERAREKSDRGERTEHDGRSGRDRSSEHDGRSDYDGRREYER